MGQSVPDMPERRRVGKTSRATNGSRRARWTSLRQRGLTREKNTRSPCYVTLRKISRAPSLAHSEARAKCAKWRAAESLAFCATIKFGRAGRRARAHTHTHKCTLRRGYIYFWTSRKPYLRPFPVRPDSRSRSNAHVNTTPGRRRKKKSRRKERQKKRERRTKGGKSHSPSSSSRST